METLIAKGAKPNAIVEAKYMVRKTGTYIPIIKHFYKRKYREHTKITTSMHASVETGNINIVKKLMEHGGNINVSTPYGTYPFDVALQLADTNNVKRLFRYLRHYIVIIPSIQLDAFLRCHYFRSCCFLFIC